MLQDLRDCEQVLQAMERSWYALFQRFARTSQGEVYEDPYIKRVNTGVSWGMDGVFITTIPHDKVHAIIRESITYFQQRHHPFRWYTSPLTQPCDLGEQLQAHGLEKGSPTPAMAIELDQVSSTRLMPSGLSIQEVTDLEMLDAWFHVWLTCYGMLEHKNPLFQIEKARGIDDALVQRSLGYLRGQPVASAMGFYHGEVARINVVATLPEARRQGIGTAMILQQLQEAHEAGYCVAVLYAAPLAVALYRRMGFVEYCQIISYRFGRQHFRPHLM